MTSERCCWLRAAGAAGGGQLRAALDAPIQALSQAVIVSVLLTVDDAGRAIEQD